MSNSFFKPHQKVTFHTKGMESDLEQVEIYESEKYNGQIAVIICLATFTELGEKDYEYYDIEFSDGTYYEAISGYHLEALNNHAK